MRGTGGKLRECGLTERFIPARAGNGARGRLPSSWTTVHPRACGERTDTQSAFTALTGSSPRVRGTVIWRTSWSVVGRFIPARAGNGGRSQSLVSRATVHPRACGERLVCVAPDLLTDGSSPRVRGTGDKAAGLNLWDRFIPARAGNGSGSAAPCNLSTVHPRACGERAMPRQVSSFAAGSSPRVRGTGRVERPPLDVRRFIPARAGNGAASELISLGRSVHPPRVRGTAGSTR